MPEARNGSLDPFPAWPAFDEEFIEATRDVLQSGKVNYWTGEHGRRFEEEFAAFCGCDYGVAVANGTLALELALVACDVGPGDEVVLTSRTFIASASSVAMRGAIPVFADIDVDSQNITAETVEAVITPRTKAIIAVHLAGWPCDMKPLLALAHQHGLKVIEDCAQAHGAAYDGKPVGSFGHCAAFSFCQDKIMTTGGEGGMLVTSDRDIRDRAWSYKDHGKSWEAVHDREHPPGFRWLHESFGTNWRLTEMQSALGRVALSRLPSWSARRRENAGVLTERLARLAALRLPDVPSSFQHAFYKFYAFVRPEQLKPGWNRDRIMNTVTAAGVPCYSGSCSEIYLEKAFPPELRPAKRLPVAERLGATSLMFLVHPTISPEQIRAACREVESVFADASAPSAGSQRAA